MCVKVSRRMLLAFRKAQKRQMVILGQTKVEFRQEQNQVINTR